jgi:hypothetical protein
MHRVVPERGIREAKWILLKNGTYFVKLGPRIIISAKF